MKHRILVLCIFSFLCLQQCAQDKVNYNLDFKTTNLKDFKWDYSLVPVFRIDSTEKIDNKYPVCFEQYSVPIFGNILDPLRVVLSQQIFIPNEHKFSDSICVSIHNKCYNLSVAQLKLFCLDTDDKLVYTDSIDINNDSCWTRKSLSFPVLKAEKMLLGFYAFGWDMPSPKWRDIQKLYIDRLSVTINNRDIEEYNYRPKPKETKLDIGKAIKLSPGNDSSFAQIPIPDDKKIIGIGESMHGSKTINQIEVQLMKQLIESRQCRLLLFEADIHEMLLANLYVQGQTPEDYHKSLSEVSGYTLFSSDVFCDFMLWLRQYNKKAPASEKVRVYGLLDVPSESYMNPLFDFLYAFYSEKNKEMIFPLLGLLNFRELDKALEITCASEKLKQVLENDNYSDFVWNLTKAVERLRALKNFTASPFHDIYTRDYSMFETAQHYISEYTKKEDKVCIVAHNGHIAKQGNYLFPYIQSMGYYLNNYYGNACYSAGIFVGKGNVLSASSLEKKQFWTREKLDDFLDGSIEDLCAKTGIPSFYYSTIDLEAGNFYYRNIGNTCFHSSSDNWFGNLRSSFDGLFFISESQAAEKPIFENGNDLTVKKIIEHADIYKSLKQDNASIEKMDKIETKQEKP